MQHLIFSHILSLSSIHSILCQFINNFWPLGFPLSKNKVKIHQHCLRISSNICGFCVITFDLETLCDPCINTLLTEGLSTSLPNIHPGGEIVSFIQYERVPRFCVKAFNNWIDRSLSMRIPQPWSVLIWSLVPTHRTSSNNTNECAHSRAKPAFNLIKNIRIIGVFFKYYKWIT